MIERIDWEKRAGELPSPFMRGSGERPLRLTFHSQCLVDLNEDEKDAMTLLDELSNLQEVQFFSTSPGKFPYIVFEEPSEREDYIPLILKSANSKEEIMQTLVWNKRQWPGIAARLLNPKAEDSKSILDTLLLSQAHKSIRGDVLITKSHLLLSNRGNRWVRETNPRTPLEATRLVGLFLRSRNNYTHSASTNVRRTANRGLFYWVLARHRLPNMWRYFAACVSAAKLRGDDTDALGEAILQRAVRAMEALDAIGIKFYAFQDRDDFLEIIYHFDYLTLLLAGAIDAQARIAKRVYHLGKDERWASFRNKKFRDALKVNNANELYEQTSSSNFQSVLTLLYELRNTIHGAAPRAIIFQDNSISQATHMLELPNSISEQLLKATRELSTADEWGLKANFKKVWLEPYSYASALVDVSFKAINNVAGCTEVTRLFPNGQPVSPLMDAPKDPVFELGKRFSLMA